MNAVGSNTTALFMKKMPDHQREAVAKISPYNILNKERLEQMAKTATTMNGFNSAYYDKGFKTFKDFKEISKKLKYFDDRINTVKNYEAYEELPDMYLTGESKLTNEAHYAR